MATQPKKAKAGDKSVASGAPSYVLQKSFGYVEQGKHKFIAGGTELLIGKDDALITLLTQKGAALEFNAGTEPEASDETNPAE